MFAIDNKQRLQIFVTNGSMKPESGWTIIGMIQPELTENIDVISK